MTLYPTEWESLLDDLPWRCPSQPLPVWADVLQSLERRQCSSIPTFLTPFTKRINELISISYFASHGWLQTLLRPHFPYQSGPSYEPKEKSQEHGPLLILETGCLFSGDRVLVKVFCVVCPVPGGRGRLSHSIPHALWKVTEVRHASSGSINSGSRNAWLRLVFLSASLPLSSLNLLSCFAKHSSVNVSWIWPHPDFMYPEYNPVK